MLNVCETNLSSEEAKRLRSCILEASDVFAVEKDELGTVTDVQHRIETGDNPPVRQSPRRIPFSVRPQMARMVNEMLGAHVIEESSSPWASPVVLVAKKSGDLRFCVDYRRLNALTSKDVFPLPRIDDILDQLSGKCIFSTLDGRTGYWQIKVHESSREKTAFVTMDGLYEFRVMPFGLCNAPATFQRLMQKTLAGLSAFCSVYIDDVIVFSRSLEEHLDHLSQVFSRLRKVGLKLHPSKCQFAFPEVPYLGHIISAKGISPNPDKVRAVRDYPVPTNVRAIREFLGIAGYYRRFIPNFAKVAQPLYHLIKKDVQYMWSSACQEAFTRLKELLTSPPVLAYPNFDRRFVLHTDASSHGLGAVLEQEQDDGLFHPIAYASRTLSKHEKRYGITDMEALGVVWAAKHFRAYLLGHDCTVFTDHAPLKAMLRAKHQTGKLARWAAVISELNLNIQYRPGRKNSNADALSRSPLEVGVDDLESEADHSVLQVAADGSPVTNVPRETDEISKLQSRDDELRLVRQYLKDGTLPSDEKRVRKIILQKDQFVLLEDVLYHIDSSPQHRLQIAVPYEMRHQLMEENHSGQFGGHFAGKGLYKMLAQHYWWEGMYRDVHLHCRGCLPCAAYRGSGPKARPLLKPIPVGGPFQRVGVDILEMPQTAQGNRYIVVFADYLTKWVEAYPTADQTSETIARLLIDHIVCRHGVPAELLSDRGANLLSSLLVDLCRLLGMKKVNTTASHPQTDGLVENVNRTIRAMIAKHAHKFGNDWDKYLQQLLFAYRIKPHDSSGESPFFLLYGRDARCPTETALSQPLSPYKVDIDDYRSEVTLGLAEAWKTAQTNIALAQKRQKVQHDKKARVIPLKIGDRVMVFMPSETTGKQRKLALPYHGPYRVVDVADNTVSVRPVDKPDKLPMLVNMERVTKCSDALPNVSWLGPRSRRKHQKKVTLNSPPKSTLNPNPSHNYNLRSGSVN